MNDMPKMEEMPTMMEMDDKMMPAMKDWKVGGKYKIMVDVEQMSMRKGEDGKIRGSFKVNKATPYKKESKSYSRETIAKAMAK